MRGRAGTLGQAHGRRPRKGDRPTARGNADEPPTRRRTRRRRTGPGHPGRRPVQGTAGLLHHPLRFGYGTNGLTDLRLDDALGLLADLGYDGVGLTLDHMHLDPLARDLAARTRRVARRLSALGLGVTVETGARYVLDPRRKHGPSLLDPDPDDRAARVDLLLRAVRVAADLGAHAVHCFSGITPAGHRPGHRLAPPAPTPSPPSWTPPPPPASRSPIEPEPGHLLATLADFHRLRTRTRRPRRPRPHPRHRPLPVPGTLPPADCVRAAAPWLRHVQIEDMRRGVHEHLPFGDGEIDFPPVLDRARRHRLPGPDRRRTAPPLPRGPRTRPQHSLRLPAHAAAGAARHGAAPIADPPARHSPTPTRSSPEPPPRRPRPATDAPRRQPRTPTPAPGSPPTSAKPPAPGWPGPWTRQSPAQAATDPSPPGSCASPPPAATAAPSTRTPYASCCCTPPSAGPDALTRLYRQGTAAERRAVLLALPHLVPGPDALPLVEDALRTNDTRLVAAAVGPYAAAPPRRARLAARRAEVPLHRRARRRGRPTCAAAPAATPNSPACSATSPPNAPPPAGPSPRTCTTSWPWTAPPDPRRRRSPDAHLRPPHPHDVAHHRRLRGHVRRGRPRRRRTLLLARPAPHLARLLLRLLRLPPGLGALPRRPVRHRPPLHDRPQPQGGERPPLHPRPRRTAPLSRQGPRRRRRRDRLRLDDPGRGHRPRRPAPARRRPRAARARPHPAPRQARRTAPHPRRRPRVRTCPRSASCSTTSTRPPSRRPSTAAAGSASPSTPTPRWTRTAWSRSCRDARHRSRSWSTPPPTGARATRSRPARSATPCSTAGFTDDDVDQVLWRNPVAFYGLSGRLDLDVAATGRHPRGQLHPARRGVTHALPPPRRLHRPPRLLHQRAPRRDPRRRPRPAARPLRTRTPTPRPRPPRHRPVAGQGRRPRPDHRPRRPARRCAPNSTAAASKSSPSTASRTRASAPRRSSTASTSRTGPTPSGSPTPPTWPGCSPRLLPDDVTEGTISTLPLAWRTAYDDDAAPPPPATALATLAERLDALDELTGRTIRIGLEPEPGCTVETTADAIAPLTGDRPRPHRHLRRHLPPRHLLRGPATPRWTPWPPPASPSSRPSSPPPCTPNTPTCPRSARPSPPSTNPASCTRPAPVTTAGLRGTDDLAEALSGGALPDTAPWRAHFHVPLHAPPAPPLTSTLAVLTVRADPARRRPAPAHPPPGGRDLHLAGPPARDCAPAPAPSSPTASPPNSPSPATC